MWFPTKVFHLEVKTRKPVEWRTLLIPHHLVRSKGLRNFLETWSTPSEVLQRFTVCNSGPILQLYRSFHPAFSLNFNENASLSIPEPFFSSYMDLTQILRISSLSGSCGEKLMILNSTEVCNYIRYESRISTFLKKNCKAEKDIFQWSWISFVLFFVINYPNSFLMNILHQLW